MVVPCQGNFIHLIKISLNRLVTDNILANIENLLGGWYYFFITVFPVFFPIHCFSLAHMPSFFLSLFVSFFVYMPVYLLSAYTYPD